jgi:endonuclease G
VIQAQDRRRTLARRFQRFAAAALVVALPFAGACRREKKARSSPPPTPVSVQAWEDAYKLCFHGCPSGAPEGDRVVQRSLYVLSNNPRTKFADWVAYVVTARTIGGTRNRVWHRDPELPKNETLSPADYEGISKIDMQCGHQAPLASLTGSPAWEEADDLSNTTPQARTLNNGAWKGLERAERKLALSGAEVHVVTGTLYEREMPHLPRARLPHTIPSGYWKVVAVESGGEVEVAAFIMDQSTPGHTSFCASAVTVRDVEARAHLNIEPGIEAARQEKLETTRGGLLPRLGCR